MAAVLGDAVGNRRQIVAAMGGWKASLILGVAYVLAEFATYKAGGDLGAFLYVTMHFVLMPLASMFVIGATAVRVLSMETMLQKLVGCGAIIVPATIIFLAFTGNTITMDLFGIDFNR